MMYETCCGIWDLVGGCVVVFAKIENSLSVAGWLVATHTVCVADDRFSRL